MRYTTWLLETSPNTYTMRYPDRMIYFRGSTKERTRLYRMAIGINLEELGKTFEIYAEIDGNNNFILFRKNMDVLAFLIKRRGKKST
jgi:hypothetical protein